MKEAVGVSLSSYTGDEITLRHNARRMHFVLW
jgi:hypothetical protein